jgi:hypothetical protein
VSNEQSAQFLTGLDTVTGRLRTEAYQLSEGRLSRQEFLERYGHLRPGTYDILSNRYDESFDTYFYVGADQSDPDSVPNKYTSPTDLFQDHQLRAIDIILQDHGLELNAQGLLRFLSEAIKGREYAKFLFSKSVSEIIQLLAMVGRDLGFSNEQMSHVDVAALLTARSASTPVERKRILAQDALSGSQMYEITKLAKCPLLMGRADEIYSFELNPGTPTYITQKKVAARTVSSKWLTKEHCRGHIVLLESADPGYDWIFSHGIAGLITMFGGPNSHMAIRTAELGIAAVIGSGEQRYRQWSKARMIEIDAMHKKVNVLQ